jgi:hypothetical protein
VIWSVTVAVIGLSLIPAGRPGAISGSSVRTM